MHWKIRRLGLWMRCSLISLSSLPLLAGTVDAGVEYLWPVPDSEDIRGTYCDYRDSIEKFHTGVDIHGQGGSDGLLVWPMVSEVVVNEDPYQDGAGCWVVELKSAEDDGETVAYAHVTARTPNDALIWGGRHFLLDRTLYSNRRLRWRRRHFK
jgi:hypothetical protein